MVLCITLSSPFSFVVFIDLLNYRYLVGRFSIFYAKFLILLTRISSYLPRQGPVSSQLAEILFAANNDP